jgi:hypothetical protein
MVFPKKLENFGDFSPKNKKTLLRRPPLERKVHFLILVCT